jgi:uncharacterized repeat protein (TIGR01451 family)
VLAGDDITYTIRLRNTGSVTAPHATLTDALPVGVELVPGTLEGGAYNVAQRAITWSGPLAPQDDHLVRFVARSAATLVNGTLLTNTALIGDGSSAGAASGSLLARQATVRLLRADLATSDMRVDRATALAGEVVTYTLRLRNTGARDTLATLECMPPALLTVDEGSLYASAGELWWDGGLHWQGNVQARGLVILRVCARIAADATPQLLTTEARLVDAGGIETALAADVQVNRPGETWLYLPLFYSSAP